MKKLIYLLTAIPLLACAEQAPVQTLDGSTGGTTAVAERAGSAERLSAYQRAGDWRHFAELFEATIKKYPPKFDGGHLFADAVGVGMGGDVWALNSTAWDVFKKCDDKAILNHALSWSELSIRIVQPAADGDGWLVQFLDTKANLLYKLGRVDEAIASEQAAIAQGIANAKKAGKDKGSFFDEYSAELQKMRKGEPTWPAK
jgi:hypothetical protein